MPNHPTNDLDDRSIKKTQLIFGLCVLLVPPVQLFLNQFTDPNGPQFVFYVIFGQKIVLGFAAIMGTLMVSEALYYFFKHRK